MAVTYWDDRVRDEMAVLTSKYGVNSFKTFMAYKEAIMLRDDELLECFYNCAKIGALAQVHAENGDAIHRVSSHQTYCCCRPSRVI